MRTTVFSLFITLAITIPIHAVDDYKLGPDSMPQEGVPRGEVTKFKWESKIFAGTVRDGWLYVPKQYDAAKPACVMVFQDGGSYQSTNRSEERRVGKECRSRWS